MSWHGRVDSSSVRDGNLLRTLAMEQIEAFHAVLIGFVFTFAKIPVSNELRNSSFGSV